MANEVLGLEITELRLGLPGGDCNFPVEKNGKKRAFSDYIEDENSTSDGNGRPKNRIIGWPPVCTYRQKKKDGVEIPKFYVKVSMDGAPFLRKIDLNSYKAYSDLSLVFQKLFGCFGIGTLAGKESNNSEYVPIYEDKDGDWMLLGDVPWEMFLASCKRLRIMKRSEVKGFGLHKRSLDACFEGHTAANTAVEHGIITI
ncbi:auxin-induced protein AUX22-like [Tasmannia lanceolata]|uniref:auxin-induced protein AUX22-like n=1 Tax=Tasmannia lanceolata TaxID=3420 RepID=UPI004062F44B